MALELLGWSARRHGDYADAVAAFEEALGVVRDLELRDEVPFLLVDLADLHVLTGDFEAAAILHKQALAARREGSYERARELHLEALSFFREAGFTQETAYSLACLGFVEELRGDLDAAEARHRESLPLARDLPDPLPLALALEGLASVAGTRKGPERAAMLLGAAESIRTRAGTPRSPLERAAADRASGAAVSALGHVAFTRAVERGRGLSAEEAAEYALAADPVT